MFKIVLVFALLAATADEQQIRAIRQRSNQAFAAGDFKTFAESLAADFVIVRGNGTTPPSRQAYLEQAEASARLPGAIRYQRITDKIEVSNAAPLAAEHGHWVATLPNGKRAYGGTYLAMWRKQDNAWKIRSELFVLLTCEDAAACASYRK